MKQALARELTQALFEDSNEALFLIDMETNCFIDANQIALRLSGRDRQGISGLSAAEILRAQQQDEIESLFDAVKSRVRFHSPDGFELQSCSGSDLDDEFIPVELTLKPLGKSSCALLQLKDTRARRSLEARAALAETELSLVLNTVAAAVWCAERNVDAELPKPAEGLTDWHFRYLSPAMERVAGWPLHFFADGPHKFADIIHPDDRMAVLTERLTFLLSPERFFSIEMRLIGADGTERWVRSDMQATRDAQGRAVRIDGVVTDISRSKRAELSLRESQHWLSRMLETNANGILVLDLAGRISFVNLAAQRLFDLQSNELLDRDWNELPWRCGQHGNQTIQDIAFRTLQSRELSLERRDGTTATVSLSAAPFRDDAGRVTGVVVTLFDLSGRKRADEAIRRSEERYRRLFERNLAGVCRCTLEGQFLEVNPAFAHIFGYDSPDDLLGMSQQDLYFIPEEWPATIEQLKAKSILNNVESRRRRKDGGEIWVLENVAILPEGAASVIEATLVDITERKRAEQTLYCEHALLLSLLNSIPDFIFYKDRDGRYRGCNPAFETYSGLREADIIGRTLADVFMPEMAAALESEDRQIFDTGKPLRLDRLLQTKLGPRSVDVVINPMVDNDGNIIGLLGIGRDITERLRLEEQLRQTGKMEAIGRLAGGVAHDFNNLLTIILGNLSLAQTIMAGNSVCELLADSEQAALRAAELTNQLLGFARRRPLTVQALDLNRSLAETLQLLRRTIDPRVTIDTGPAADLWAVEVDSGQMSQVLINLCLNARDALPEGGQIRIETANVHLTEAQTSRNLDARPGDFVRLSLADNGPGIPLELHARIFEPFFTTKPFGAGTGLGLAVVFGIIRQHQGWIECHSEPGAGARFDIYLPRSNKAAAEPAALPDIVSSSGSETILLVDDEPMIREVGKAILSKQGYGVMLAEDGAVAIDLYRRHQGEIALVLLDLSMPNLSGKEALRLLRGLNPDVRVLVASGYSPDQLKPGELEGVHGFISKPYRSQDLTTAIRAALDQSTHPDESLSHSADLTSGTS